MHQIAARVPEEVDDAIEAFSDENDCSRSEAIRTLLKRSLEYAQAGGFTAATPPTRYPPT